MIIREYNINDNKQVIDLYNKCFSYNCNKINLNPTGTILILLENNKIIGMGTLDVINDIFKGIKYGYLNNICIDPEYQGKGLGNYLLKELEKLAIKKECKYLMLTSNKNRIIAHKLYLKNGYEIIDTCVFKKKFN